MNLDAPLHRTERHDFFQTISILSRLAGYNKDNSFSQRGFLLFAATWPWTGRMEKR